MLVPVNDMMHSYWPMISRFVNIPLHKLPTSTLNDIGELLDRLQVPRIMIRLIIVMSQQCYVKRTRAIINRWIPLPLSLLLLPNHRRMSS
jgi:hypothetical protein